MKQIIILIIFIIFSFQIGKANSFISLKNDIDTSIVIQTQRQKCIIVQLINKFTDTEGLTKILLIKKDKKKLISKTLPSTGDIKNLNININTGQASYLKLNMVEEIIFTIAISILRGLKVVSSYTLIPQHFFL